MSVTPTVPILTTGELVEASDWNAIRSDMVIAMTPLASDGTVNGELKGYGERTQTVTISAGVVTINLANGNHVIISMTAAITSFVITGFKASGLVSPVVLYLVGDGTPRVVTYLVNTTKTVKFSNNVPFTPTTGTNLKIDKVILETHDGDTSWYGEVGRVNA